MCDFVLREGLHEYVWSHVISQHVVNMDESFLDSVAYEVVLDIDVFCVRVIFVILGDGDGGDIVQVNSGRFFKWACDLP